MHSYLSPRLSKPKNKSTNGDETKYNERNKGMRKLTPDTRKIIGGMFVSLIERPSDLVTLVEAMDPATRILSQNFCSV